MDVASPAFQGGLLCWPQLSITRDGVPAKLNIGRQEAQGWELGQVDLGFSAAPGWELTLIAPQSTAPSVTSSSFLPTHFF